MTANSPASVGLGGDGDEITAIENVEHAFDVKLNHSDAPRWLTAGDVFDSLQRALPIEERNGADVWDRFARGLSAETGVDPKKIERGSSLLSEMRIWAWVADLSAWVWSVIGFGFIAAVGVAALVGR